MPEGNDVTSAGSSAATEPEVVDERGVPLKNRIKELERKLKEKEEQMALMESEGVSETPQPEVDGSQLKKQELMSFVDDPKGYIAKQLAERRFQDEIPQASLWLRAQKGYVPEDDLAIIRIMKEHDLRASSPVQTAKTAWNLLRQEKSESSLESALSDSERTSRLKSTSPEGSGRTVPLKTGPSKQELLKQLSQASLRGDFGEEVRLNELIEEMEYQQMKK